MATEQALGESSDGRADLYALGVMLYELTAGRLPFTADDALLVISQHLYAPVVPPRTFQPDLPLALQAIILKLLSKSAADRFASAREVSQALAQVEQLFRQATPEEAPPTEVSPLDQLGRGRMVGRQVELNQLRELWQRAQQGQGHLALISGEPGVGKTRLASEMMVLARLKGAVVLQGGCYEYEATTPYLPFVEAIRQWVHIQSRDVLVERLYSTAAELAKLAPEIEARLGPRSRPTRRCRRMKSGCACSTTLPALCSGWPPSAGCCCSSTICIGPTRARWRSCTTCSAPCARTAC